MSKLNADRGKVASSTRLGEDTVHMSIRENEQVRSLFVWEIERGRRVRSGLYFCVVGTGTPEPPVWLQM